MSYEIHPETPHSGVNLANRFSQADLERMLQHLNTMGAPFEISFAQLTFLPNSRMALQASEFAREKGKFDAFHEAVFRAYFTLGKDIGDTGTLLELARNNGLDADSLKQALKEEHYAGHIQQSQAEAARLGVTAAPTFIVEGKDHIIGAQPIDVFRNVLRKY